MAANDVILLADMLNRTRIEADGLNPAEQEAYFLAHHYLKPYAPTHDDILSGIVDGANDGGIDGAYMLVNGMCVRDDAPLVKMGRGPKLEFIVFQTKNTAGFSEGAVEHMITNIPDLFDLDRDEAQLAKRFNSKVIEVTRRFIRAVRDLDMPNIAIKAIFASLKAEALPHPNVARKGDGLVEAIRRSFGTSEPCVEFLDAAAVSKYARFRSRVSKEVRLAENPISTNTSGGYIGVVSLPEYHRFISDDSGRLDALMFEANVRDYESESDVNSSIRATLAERGAGIDFWWLNNGVTVVADKVQLSGKILSLVSPQIVNGLQTSHEIYRRGASAELDERRSILVKVVEADQEVTKDRIIKATNSQTTLGTSALRATDSVQRKIEEYLQTVGLYYERRKNFYRNQQVHLSQLVSIDQLGQAVMATLVQAPHVARAAPSKVFDDDIYPLVFAEGHPLAMYSQAVTIQRVCEQFLRTEPATRGEVDNFSFHLATLATVAMTRKRQPSANDLSKLNRTPSNELLRTLLGVVRTAYSEVVNSKNYVLFDEVAKDSMSTARVLDGGQRYLLSTSRQ
ncbi:AIPR family protein [Cellulomonas sp. PhB143]|uniref:AIPR family protein n=1 Tax=Cellulomonas sp. PhB143 TaxID=2485186 RepID=UPI000F49DF07|nr:AIPR family protein [Cellulomonas sp. PhB143]ROS73070.1 AIPR protein [Cellulomonas sp. PhB143]